MKLPNCIYCGSNIEMTKDHIPPKCLYSFPYPENVITVPCCKKCNIGFSKDDEYFRTVIVIEENANLHPVANQLTEKVIRSFERPHNRKFSQSFLENTQSVDRFSAGGIYLGKSPIYKVNLERLNSTITRIVKGLFYFEQKRILPSEYSVKAHSQSQLEDAEDNVKQFILNVILDLAFMPKRIIGENIFEYRFKIFPEENNFSLWSLLFYNKILFYAFTYEI